MAIYNQALKTGKLKEAVEVFKHKEQSCDMCPHVCGVNRHKETGICNTGVEVPIAESLVHLGEEEVVSGLKGSGAIFFSNCNLSCVFCQNSDVSQNGKGQLYNSKEIADIMINLQNKGCHNINWVSPTHCVSILIEALYIAAKNGLSIPIVYNCGGYESLEILNLLDGIIDIYMPDMKWSNNSLGEKYSGIHCYTNINRLAVKEMHSQVGDLQLNDEDVAQSGLIVRYLILPNNVDSFRKTFNWIKSEIGNNTYISLLTEYYPFYQAYDIPELSRPLNEKEVQEVIDFLIELEFNKIEYCL